MNLQGTIISGLNLETTILWVVTICALVVLILALVFLLPAGWRLIRPQRPTPEDLARRARILEARKALLRAADGIMEELAGETKFYRVATLSQSLTRVSNAIRNIDVYL